MIGWLCHLMLWCVFFLGYEYPDKHTHSNHHPILGISIIQNIKSPAEIEGSGGGVRVFNACARAYTLGEEMGK